MVSGDLDNAATGNQSTHAVAGTQWMTRNVKDLRPLAIGPDGYRVMPHIPHGRAVVEEPPAQITGRFVAAQLTDVADVDQPCSIVTQQDRHVTAEAVVERARAHEVERVALPVLEAHEVLGDLAHRVWRERPERIRLADRQLVGVHEPVLLAGADDQKAHLRAELTNRLEQVHLADGVRHEGLRRRLPGRADERLRGEMNDAIGMRALDEIARRREIAQLRLDEGDALAEVLDVLGVAAPAQGAHHLGPATERELREMTADEPRDPRDQDPHPSHTTTAPAPPRRCPRPSSPSAGRRTRCARACAARPPARRAPGRRPAGRPAAPRTLRPWRPPGPAMRCRGARDARGCRWRAPARRAPSPPAPRAACPPSLTAPRRRRRRERAAPRPRSRPQTPRARRAPAPRPGRAGAAPRRRAR